MRFAPFRRSSSAPFILAAGPLVGHAGDLLNARVADREGNAIPNASVVVMPAEAASDGELAGRLQVGEADQNGSFTSRGLAAGKYFVLAVKSQLEGRDFSPELVARLQAARNRAREVIVDSSATITRRYNRWICRNATA